MARIPSPGPGRQVLEQVVGHQVTQMARGVGAFANRMGAVGIGHHRERFVVPDQFVDQLLHGLIVAVVVARAVNQQQVALQLVGEIDGRSL